MLTMCVQSFFYSSCLKLKLVLNHILENESEKIKTKKSKQNQQFFGPLIVGDSATALGSVNGSKVDISLAKWAHSIVISWSV